MSSMPPACPGTQASRTTAMARPPWISSSMGQPAHIHSGTCAELGDVVYPLTDVDASGESITVVETSLADLSATGPYAINIHLSADDIGTYVACGDIPTEAVGGEV